MRLRDRRRNRELAAAIEKSRHLFSTRQEQEAFEFLAKAVKRFPEDPEIRLLYATILLAFRPDDVAGEAAKAVELGPDDPGILVRAGHLMLNRGNREAARSYVAHANEMVEPGFVLMADLEHLDGVIAAFDGKDRIAEEKLRSAVASSPGKEAWARHLAVFLAERGRQAEAVEVLDEALKHAENKDEMDRMRDTMAREASA